MTSLNTGKTQLLIFSTICLFSTTLLSSITQGSDTKDATESQTSFFDHLLEHADSLGEPARLTLTFDHQQLLEMKYSDEDLSSTLTHDENDWEVKLITRGRYRRRICDFPPLHIKVKKSSLRAAGLKEHNKYKLVTHCSDKYDARNNLLREQLTYELYSLITDQGYRTQLIEVTYRDVDTGESYQRLGILIEDKKEMAKAYGGKNCKKCMSLSMDAFVERNLETVSLFNYMVGNADWSAVSLRNATVLRQKADHQHLLVPYDFDFAGLVDAEYAKPNVNFQQVNIKDRIWIWEYEEKPVHLADVIAHYQEKESMVMDYVANYPGLSKRSRRQVTKYLASFFRDLNDGSFMEEIQ